MKHLRSLVPWGSREEFPFATFQKEMNRLLEGFSQSFGLPTEKNGAGFPVPNVDVKETDEAIQVSAELPGIDEKDLDISLTKDSLTIKGEKKEEREEKKGMYYQMERSYGSFLRTIALPSDVDVNKVDASFKKGVLNILLPKTEAARKESKKVQIRTS